MSTRYTAAYLPRAAPPAAIGLASEHDMALACVAVALAPAAMAFASEVASPLPALHLRLPGVGVEQDIAAALPAAHWRAVGVADEADAALQLPAAAARAPELASECALAFAPQPLHARPGVIAVEADTALALGESGEEQAGADAADVWGYTLPSGETASAVLAELRRLVADVHAVHGLDPAAPLIVTPTRRAAGAVEQDIATAADGTVTVTRR